MDWKRQNDYSQSEFFCYRHPELFGAKDLDSSGSRDLQNDVTTLLWIYTVMKF